ncbi:MAG: 4Fe-4S cluster-binding domain-containing protein [Oscillospiraceae bacterium]|nr:4Fe-4S cluster-binding domain-containing protein [Oscillospiraceae bacterium]
MNDIRKGIRFSPSICLTHSCNLDCIYCYQKHDGNNRMSFETACKCIDYIFNNVPDDMNGVEISFIGGEPLIEFELIKKIVEYTIENYKSEQYIFYATTNGTVLNAEMKQYFTAHKDHFVLGLSLDGIPEVHNKNRSNSFDKIDIDFFIKTWPNQSVKMTLSEYSLEHLAESIIYIHSLGFKEIGGVNLFEGTFDWSDPKYIRTLIPQLQELVSYYVENDSLTVNQMLSRKIYVCEETNRPKRKWCGIGTGAIFFDTDGTRLPCPFITPMTFDKQELEDILKTDFNNQANFIDDDCFKNCYIYPICPHCAGANYLTQKTFKNRDKSRCRIQKLITLYCADLQAKRLLKNPKSVSEDKLYYTISAVKRIREEFLDEFRDFADIM